ncbi:MAG: hypothetical protein JWO80_6379, partial [Bryobacterales bacterium]|nr:hypothetical protein [Bryobacterales bacterium]
AGGQSNKRNINKGKAAEFPEEFKVKPK